MQITLLRHGQPDLPEWGKTRSSKMPKWIESYNTAGVKNLPPQHCQHMLQENSYNLIVCSNLNRSIHSAEIIGYSANKIDSKFREAELPVIKLPLLKLTPHHWSIIFRLFWLAGISPNVESLKPFRNRVKLAATELNQLAINHGTVLFIGHGIFNRFLAMALIANGWSGEEAPNGNKYKNYQYWEYANYTKNNFNIL